MTSFWEVVSYQCRGAAVLCVSFPTLLLHKKLTAVYQNIVFLQFHLDLATKPSKQQILHVTYGIFYPE